MVKPNIFEITLGRHHGSYVPGEVLAGYVTMEVLEEMEVKEIGMSFKGKEKVKFTKGSGDDEKTYEEVYRVFKEKVKLFKPDSTTTMAPNRYTYSFQFTIPTTAKTSFEGEYGYVRYEAKCKVEVPGTFNWNHVTTKNFTITRVVDLNFEYSEGREPVKEEEEGTFCCWCCESEKVTCNVGLDKAVFVCGEGARISGTITNPTTRPLKVSAYFKRKVLYQIRSHEKSETNILLHHHFADVPVGETVQMDDMMQIPPCPPQSSDIGMINAGHRYLIEFWVEPPGCCTGLGLVMEFPVVIGTIQIPGTFCPYQIKSVDGVTMSQPMPLKTDVGGVQAIPPVSLVPFPFFKKQHKLELGKLDLEEEKQKAAKPADLDSSDDWHPSYPFYSWEKKYFTLGIGENEEQIEYGIPMQNMQPPALPSDGGLPPPNYPPDGGPPPPAYPPFGPPPGAPVMPPPGQPMMAPPGQPMMGPPGQPMMAPPGQPIGSEPYQPPMYPPVDSAAVTFQITPGSEKA